MDHLFAHIWKGQQLYLIPTWDPIRCYHSRPEWTWNRCQWRDTLHSPKFQIVYQDLRRGSLTPLQRCSRCILQPQPTRLWLNGGFTSLQKCSRCILQPQPTRLWLKGGFTSLQKCSRCILQPQPTGLWLKGGFIPPQRCRLCIPQPSWLGFTFVLVISIEQSNMKCLPVRKYFLFVS